MRVPDKIKLGGVLVFLTVVGYFCADIITKSVSLWLVVPPAAVINSKTVTVNKVVSEGEVVANTAPMLAPPPTAFVAPASGEPSPGQTGPDSPWDQWLTDPQHNLTLIGTMVGIDLEIAVVMGGGQQYAVDRGEQLGSWKVIRITDVDVTFQKDANTFTTLKLPMLVEASPSPSPAALDTSNPRFRHQRGNGPLLNVGHRGNTIVVQRTELDKVLANPQGFTSGLRLDVAPNGIKVNYLDASNPFYYFGLRQGDVMLRINDQELHNQDDGVRAYLMLKSENSLTFSIDRNGQSVQIPVEIQ